MTRCRCGCGKPARTAKGYAGVGCSLRAIPREERSARSRGWVQANRAEFIKRSRKGGSSWRKRQWDELLDKWLDDEMAPVDALAAAYRLGYLSGHRRGTRNGHRKAVA